MNKKLIKNKKLLFGIIIGLIIGTGITGVVAYSVYANKVTYANTGSELQSTDVQGAIDELYTKVKYELIDGNTIDFATIQTNTAKTILASLKGICINRNNNIICFKSNNWAKERDHIQQVFSDVSCTVNSSYVDCIASDFYCRVRSSGYLGCRDYSDDSLCRVYTDGTITCT